MRSRRRPFALIAVSVATLVTLVGPAGYPSSAGPGEAAPTITWRPCHKDSGFPFQCGRVDLPLDYSNPNAGSITLALLKLPASDPSTKIGTLFLNPGGPGGSGVDFALFAGPYLYGGAIQSSFDIVGFDPRGIIRSTPLRCFDSPDQWGPYFTNVAFPRTRKQERIWRQADLYLDHACEERGGPILDHMATADAARDLDRLRAAVGDQKLTYMGVSYGSYLGVTYANMFPGHVRALIVDGVLDPIAWSTGVDGEGDTIPFSTRLRSDMGAQATLDEFFRLCDAGRPNCPFAPHSAARFQRLADRLARGPVKVVDPGTGQSMTLNYSFLISITLGAMYDSPSWPDLASFLAEVEAQVSPQRLGRSLHALRQAEGLLAPNGTPLYRNYLEGFPGVACSDSDNPGSYRAWSDQGAIADERFGYFGRLWTWVSSICARWPGADPDRYVGPFDRATSNPVLVIGNLFDPATRYQGAERVRQLLPNSALLTLHGWGHTSLFSSSCIDRLSVEYLKTVATPGAGKICQQDEVPFRSSSRASASDALRARIVSGLLPGAVLRSVGS